MDAVSLSTANIHVALKSFGSVERKQAECLRVLEFVSGKAPSMAVRGALTQWPQLIDHLRAAAQQRGRLERPLSLPVSWPDAGVYRICSITKEDEFVIGHRFTLNEITVQALMLLLCLPCLLLEATGGGTLCSSYVVIIIITIVIFILASPCDSRLIIVVAVMMAALA